MKKGATRKGSTLFFSVVVRTAEVKLDGLRYLHSSVVGSLPGQAGQDGVKMAS